MNLAIAADTGPRVTYLFVYWLEFWLTELFYRESYFKEICTPSFYHIYTAQIAKIMLQYKDWLLPNCFEDMFLLRSQIQDQNIVFSLPNAEPIEDFSPFSIKG